MSRTSVRFFFSAVMALLCSAGDVWAFGFNVEPARVEVSVPAGKRRGKTVSVNNASNKPIHLNLYVRDVITLPDGTNDFPPAGSTDWSCATWVQFAPAELDLTPGETRDVRVSVTAPPDAAGGHYAMLFFETAPSYAEQGIGVNFRIGALVEAVIPKTQRYQMRIADLTFVKPNQIHVALFNEGNLLIRPKGRIKILSTRGETVGQVGVNPKRLGVLPKTIRTISHELENPLAPGSYRLKAEVDYGARSILVGERAFIVQPTPAASPTAATSVAPAQAQHTSSP